MTLECFFGRGVEDVWEGFLGDISLANLVDGRMYQQIKKFDWVSPTLFFSAVGNSTLFHFSRLCVGLGWS